MNNRLLRYFTFGQAGFCLMLIVCILLQPQGLYANEGISYFSARPATVVPYALGLLCSAWFSWRIAEVLAANRTDRLQYWFQLLAVLIVSVVAIPFAFNDMWRTLHTWLSMGLFVVEQAFLFWLAVKIRREPVNWIFLVLSVGAIILTLSYLNPIKGYLIAGEVLFQLIFGLAAYRFLKSLVRQSALSDVSEKAALHQDISAAVPGSGSAARQDEQGFTIVELMIALSVLSVLLMMSTLLLTQIGRIYNKGTTMANIQNSSRNLIDDISSALEFGGSDPKYGSAAYSSGGSNVTVNSLCFDTKRYSYIVGRQLAEAPQPQAVGQPQTYHVMWEDTMQSNASCVPMDITQKTPADPPSGEASVVGSGRELMPLRSRLTAFSVQETPAGSHLYAIVVNVAYGDNDLLNDSGTRCKGDTGQEYCATSNLATVVTRRLQ